MQDTLQTTKDSLNIVIQSVEQTNLDKVDQHLDSFNWWVVVAVIELVLIIILFYKLNEEKNENLLHGDVSDILKKAKSKDINMTDLMNSINYSKELYKKLIRKCHPDRFQDKELKKKAKKLFQHISENRRNYPELTKLKKQAEQELNIKF